MHYYKYGIVIHQTLHDYSSEWIIAFLTGPVTEHGCLNVSENKFNFLPCPGDSVKARFDENLQPSIVSKCDKTEWIRDTEVINNVVVIFAIVHISEKSLTGLFNRGFEQYNVIENEDTDFQKIAIPNSYLQFQMNSRSHFQKANEPWIYRIGVFWDPIVFDNGISVNWRYYRDYDITPIFENYHRETTLPYISDSMHYGVLEAIAIAENENGVLMYTNMGCVVLSRVTCDVVPSLGSVHLTIAKRCLPEESFGFTCCYELLPTMKKNSWNSLKIIVDNITNSVYIEAKGECHRMPEDQSRFCMIVPKIGRVHRGLESYLGKLLVRKTYDLRIEFLKDGDSFYPVIVDICLSDDDTVDCRIVYISQATKTYFAVLEPCNDVFERIKNSIDYIAIPFRVLFCSKGIRVENEELLLYSYRVRIRSPRDSHDIVDAVHVLNVIKSPKLSAFSIFNGVVWLKALVKIQKICDGSIDLHCPRLGQQIVDYSRITAGLPLNSEIAVHAEFALTPGNVPVFWVRNVARTIYQLPKITAQTIAHLPSLQTVLADYFLPETSITVEVPILTPRSSSSTSEELHRNVTRSESLDIGLLPDYNEEVPTILNETEYERQFRFPFNTGSNSEVLGLDEDVIITESLFESSITTRDRACESIISDVPDNTSFYNEIVTESVIASAPAASSLFSIVPKLSEITTSKRSIDKAGIPSLGRRSPFGYTIGNEEGYGFGPSSSDNFGTSSGRGRRRVKYGIRKLRNMDTHYRILHEVVYHHLQTRFMFTNHRNRAFQMWLSLPNTQVTKWTKNSVLAIPVEMVNARYTHFKQLIRFVLVDNWLAVQYATVVVPVGGQFPELPRNFQLGEPYKMDHFFSHIDPLVRIGGFSRGFKGVAVEQPPIEKVYNMQTMRINEGNLFLRMETHLLRPCIPEVESEVFELWTTKYLPGHVIVEKTPEVKAILRQDPLEPLDYIHFVYTAVIEPVAGGPIEASCIRTKLEVPSKEVLCIFWRVVVDSCAVRSMRLVQRNEKPVPPEPVIPLDIPDIPFKDYGTWETLRINSILSQQRLDRLRALGDPRVKIIDGPDLQPEIEIRKVDVNKRRQKMFEAMASILDKLPSLHGIGLLCYVCKDELQNKIDELKKQDDDNHPHQFKKRHYSLDLGINYIVRILVRENSYKAMNERETFRGLLRLVAECIGLNTTYVKKTEEVKLMLSYFFNHRLHSYY